MSVQTESPDDSTLIISWSPPVETNGVILSYSIIIINLKDDSTVRNEMIPADVNNIVERSLGLILYVNILSCFRDLSTAAGVPYNVSIAEVNRAGPGEFTVFIHFTRELGMVVFNLQKHS